MKKAGTIYGIRNEVTGLIYIGSTMDFVSRKRVHLHQLRKGFHHSSSLQRDFATYGEGALRFVTLEIVLDQVFLRAREQFWIWRTNCADPQHGYNIFAHVVGPTGYRHTAAAKAKIAAAGVGRKRPKQTHSPETRMKIGMAHKGKKRSAEARSNMKRAAIGRVFPAWAKTAPNPGMTGRHHSEDTKRKIAAAQLGVPKLRGRHPRKAPMSLAHRAALSAARRRRTTTGAVA